MSYDTPVDELTILAGYSSSCEQAVDFNVSTCWWRGLPGVNSKSFLSGLGQQYGVSLLLSRTEIFTTW